MSIARTLGVLLEVAGRLARATLGLLGIAAVVGLLARAPARDNQASSDDPIQPATRVVLTVPEGKMTGDLVIVDPSGRELATLTRWYNDDTAVVIGRGTGPRVSVHVSGTGRTSLLVRGSARQTRICTRPDGVPTTWTTRADPNTGRPELTRQQ